MFASDSRKIHIPSLPGVASPKCASGGNGRSSVGCSSADATLADPLMSSLVTHEKRQPQREDGGVSRQWPCSSNFPDMLAAHVVGLPASPQLALPRMRSEPGG